MAFGGQSGHYGRSNRLPSKGLNGDKQLRINNIRRICEAADFPRFRLLEPVPHLLVDCLKARMPEPPLPLLLRKRGNPTRKASAPDGRPASRGPSPSPGIPGTSLERRDAEAQLPNVGTAPVFR
jgi:hypothetical protein